MAAAAAAGGPSTTTVTASDGSYQTSQNLTWNVSSPLTLDAIPDQTSSEGDTISLAVSASDSNPGATPAFTATGLPPGLSIDTGTGAISGTLAAGTAASGPYSVTVSANDGISTASQSFTWNVSSGLGRTRSTAASRAGVTVPASRRTAKH